VYPKATKQNNNILKKIAQATFLLFELQHSANSVDFRSTLISTLTRLPDINNINTISQENNPIKLEQTDVLLSLV
jgi:hypothetical protein